MLPIRKNAPPVERRIGIQIRHRIDGPGEDAVLLRRRPSLGAAPFQQPGQKMLPLKLLLHRRIPLRRRIVPARLGQPGRTAQHRHRPGKVHPAAINLKIPVGAGINRVGIPPGTGRRRPPADFPRVLISQQSALPPVHGTQLRLQYGHINMPPAAAVPIPIAIAAATTPITIAIAIAAAAIPIPIAIAIAVAAAAAIPRKRPGQHGPHRRRGRHRPGLVQPHIPAQFQRLPVGQPGGMHLAPHPVENDFGTAIIPVRPRLPKVADAGIDDARIDRPQILIANAQPRRHSGTIAFQRHIGPRRQPPHNIAGPLRLQIQRQAALVGIQMQKQPALFGMRNIPRKRPQPAGAVPVRRPFHLDHLRPIIRQQLGAVGSGDVMRKVQHLKPGQRPRRRAAGIGNMGSTSSGSMGSTGGGSINPAGIGSSSIIAHNGIPPQRQPAGKVRYNGINSRQGQLASRQWAAFPIGRFNFRRHSGFRRHPGLRCHSGFCRHPGFRRHPGLRCHSDFRRHSGASRNLTCAERRLAGQTT